MGVSTFARVAYRHVWPGIGAAFYGRRGRLEYDFVVAPGADPGRIALDVGGARSLRVTRGGALAMRTAGGMVRQLVPRAYQRIDCVRRAVRARYVLVRGGRVRVRVGAHDHRRPLVIDPALAYSTYLGGDHLEANTRIAVDAQGAAYVTATTRSPDCPVRGGEQRHHHGYDAFVAKLSPDGRHLEYSTYLGGSGVDGGRDIAVDAHGAAYVTGGTTSDDFPTRHAAQRFLDGSSDAFVAKLSPDGRHLRYSTYLGGSGHEFLGSGIAVDGDGAAYVTGFTGSDDFPTTNTVPAAQGDGYVTKLSPDGRSLAYSVEGIGGEGIAVDAQGAAYALALTDGPIVTKLSPSGRTVEYSVGDVDGRGSGIAVDADGAAYVVGTTRPSAPPSGDVTRFGPGGGEDAFVVKFPPDGTGPEYSTTVGGSDDDRGLAIAVDHHDAAYITGFTDSRELPTKDAVQGRHPGAVDGFVTKLAPDGHSLDYATYLGGSRAHHDIPDDHATGIALDTGGGAYVVGVTRSTNFPTRRAV